MIDPNNLLTPTQPYPVSLTHQSRSYPVGTHRNLLLTGRHAAHVLNAFSIDLSSLHYYRQTMYGAHYSRRVYACLCNVLLFLCFWNKLYIKHLVKQRTTLKCSHIYLGNVPLCPIIALRPTMNDALRCLVKTPGGTK